jgi:hypothetical protein
MEQVREAWGWTWLVRSKQDILYALRAFARTPGFTATVIVTLALGIGATSAIVSIVNAVSLHPLPYPDADRLVVVWENSHGARMGRRCSIPTAIFRSGKVAARALSNLRPPRGPPRDRFSQEAVAAAMLAMPVGIDFSRLLGAEPALGCLFQADDLNRDRTIVLKYQFWKSAFGAHANSVGRHIA